MPFDFRCRCPVCVWLLDFTHVPLALRLLLRLHRYVTRVVYYTTGYTFGYAHVAFVAVTVDLIYRLIYRCAGYATFTLRYVTFTRGHLFTRSLRIALRCYVWLLRLVGWTLYVLRYGWFIWLPLPAVDSTTLRVTFTFPVTRCSRLFVGYLRCGYVTLITVVTRLLVTFAFARCVLRCTRLGCTHALLHVTVLPALLHTHPTLLFPVGLPFTFYIYCRTVIYGSIYALVVGPGTLRLGYTIWIRWLRSRARSTAVWFRLRLVTGFGCGYR